MIDYILPTFGRAKTHLPVFLNSLRETADAPDDVHITAVVHHGDKETIDLLNSWPSISIVEENEKEPHLAFFMNLGYQNSKGDILGYIGDDFCHVTPGWDSIVQDALTQNKWQLITGPDSYLGNEGCPTFFFCRRALVEAVGEFVAPWMRKEGTDVMWARIMGPLNLVCWEPRLTFSHNHSTRFNSDDTFRRLQQVEAPNLNDKKFWAYVRKAQANIAAAVLHDRKGGI